MRPGISSMTPKPSDTELATVQSFYLADKKILLFHHFGSE